MNVGCALSQRFRDCRLVLSAGMPRSASTWLYNAARLLLATTGNDFSAGWIGDWRSLPVRGTVLLKVHEWNQFLAERADVVLYSFRDVRDALASGKRMFDVEPTIEIARRWMADDRRWRKAADVIVRYESMRRNPRPTLVEIATALAAKNHCVDSILMELRSLKPPANAARSYDSATLLHAGHFTDGGYGTWQGLLPSGLARRLESEYADWFAENRYATEDMQRERTA